MNKITFDQFFEVFKKEIVRLDNSLALAGSDEYILRRVYGIFFSNIQKRNGGVIQDSELDSIVYQLISIAKSIDEEGVLRRLEKTVEIGRNITVFREAV